MPRDRGRAPQRKAGPSRGPASSKINSSAMENSTAGRARQARARAAVRREAAGHLELLHQLGAAGDVFNLRLVRPGDATPDWIARVVVGWLKGPPEEAECPVCERVLGLAAAFSLWTGDDDLGMGIISGICASCAQLSDGELLDLLFAALGRSGLFSDLRRLDPLHYHAGGRA
jgi:hypothetical protein